MPKYAGYEISDFFDKIDFHLIFVTAFDQYAVKAFELSALDYLLKPVEVDRLKSAVERIVESKRLQVVHEEYEVLKKTISSKKMNRLTISEKGYRTFIPFDSILALEGQSAYCKVHLEDGTSRVISKNLKQTFSYFEDEDNFIRTHKSWAINLDYFESMSISKLELKLNKGITAKVSRNKTETILNHLNSES